MRVADHRSHGFIGSALASSLEPTATTSCGVPRRRRSRPDRLQGADAVVHLAGEGDRRQALDDRAEAPHPRKPHEGDHAAGDDPGVDDAKVRACLISGSAIGYYGDRGDEVLTRTGEPATTSSPACASQWEAATAAAAEAGVRVAHVRTGIVLGRAGGALPKMLPLFKLGLGGRFGSGRQWMSWISLDDEVGAIRFLLDHDVTAR